MREWFSQFSQQAAQALGSPWALGVSIALLLVWFVMGPFYGWSDTWQLWANSSTTVITFLMVFVLQASQNRDTQTLMLKIDELIAATRPAHNLMLDVESLSEASRAKLQAYYESLAAQTTEQDHPGTTPSDPSYIEENIRHAQARDDC